MDYQKRFPHPGYPEIIIPVLIFAIALSVASFIKLLIGASKWIVKKDKKGGSAWYG